jgi:phospholipid transport system substrate-binding protein
MTKTLCYWFIGLLVGLAATQTQASELSQPEKLVRDTTNEVLERLEANKAALDENPDRVAKLVGELVLPHFDFRAMSQMVLAQNWRRASTEQRERFVAAFRGLLIHTYGSSLSEYSGQRIAFKPMHSNPDSGRATVSMAIQPDDGPSIPVAYELYQPEGSEWKVFDVVVDGVSLVQNYRSSFASEARKKGLDELIERIEERNKGRAVSAKDDPAGSAESP